MKGVVVGRADIPRIPAVMLIAAVALSMHGSAQSRSARSGVYTEEQANRGKAQYVKSCATCHLNDLSGGGTAPPLVGDLFLSNWLDRTVADLLERFRSTMPQNEPGSLSRETYLDILVYVLQANDYPAGPKKLDDDPEALAHIALK
jgi:quinoprotein glucose dehydrogenase